MDIFVEEHIELLTGAAIEASQQSDYVKFIRNKKTENVQSHDVDGKAKKNEGGTSNEIDGERTDAAKLKRIPITENSDQLNKWKQWTEILDNADSDSDNFENDQQNKTRGQNNMLNIGCRNGGEPGGAHRCIQCEKAVHILPCCSISIGDEEGYGEKRLCNACAVQENHSASQASSVSEVQFNEEWNKSKKKQQANI